MLFLGGRRNILSVERIEELCYVPVNSAETAIFVKS